jgi:hypothetical protein
VGRFYSDGHGYGHGTHSGLRCPDALVAKRFGGGGHAHAAGFEVGGDNPVSILLDQETGHVVGLHSMVYTSELLASKAEACSGWHP